jgi:hypothetical protein
MHLEVREGVSMKSMIRFFSAAILAIAALALLAIGTQAGCDEGEPDCPLIPPQSRQVAISTSHGSQITRPGADGQPIQAAPLSMPLPVKLNPEDTDKGSLRFNQLELDPIQVRLRRQDPFDVYCGIQALGMALEPLEGGSPSETAMLQFLDSNGYLYDSGTGVEELARTAQSFGYEGSMAFHNWNIENLRSELDSGHPVVIDLGANGSEQPGHFITLTGISEDWNWVSYSDPIMGERTISLAEFMRLWEIQGRSGVSVAVAPPTVGSPDYTQWTALAAAMMAALALGPTVLSDYKRRGLGGFLANSTESLDPVHYVGKTPPYKAPSGMKWVRGKAKYKTETHKFIEYKEVIKRKLQRVQVGTESKKIPYTKKILVDNGRWVADYKIERYIKGYKTERYLSYYKNQRYVRYYRTKLVRTRYGFSRQRIPVFGYRKIPVYKNYKLPVYGTRQVPAGRHWESKWEYESYTEYRTVEKPVYEQRWVELGVERIPIEKTVEQEILTGYEWILAPDGNSIRSGRTSDGDDPISELNPEIKIEKPPVEFETDILEEMRDLRASMPHRPAAMLTTTPLRIRQDAGTEFKTLRILNTATEILWTGKKKNSNGQTWYEVSCCDPISGELLTGWVHSGYLKFAPVTSSSPDINKTGTAHDGSTAEQRWFNYLSSEERDTFIRIEKLKLESFWAELARLTIPRIGMSGGFEALFIREEIDSLLEPPDWYLNGDMPDSFYKPNLLDEDKLRVLQFILNNPDALSGEITDRTWDVIAAAFHVNEEDLKLQVFHNAYWEPQSTTTAGSYPISLFVIRNHGHYLLSDPSPGSGNVTNAFLGVPRGELVQWDGTYQHGVDENGHQVIYYKVCWEYNGKEYRGWIPNKYLSPKVEQWDDESGIPGDFVDPTFGYGEGVDGWIKYHTYGGAQFLDLRAILIEIGMDPAEIPSNLSRHTNLCGPLAVMQNLNVSLEEGFRRWIEASPQMKEKLLCGEMTSSENLKDLFHAFEFNVNTYSGPDRLIQSITMGQPAIALVATSNGKLSAEGNQPHWISIRFAERGEPVRYYNPYTNKDEEVSWETFYDAWEQATFTEGNRNTDRLFITLNSP